MSRSSLGWLEVDLVRYRLSAASLDSESQIPV